MPMVRIGVGVNTGECCVGNLGSATRFDYSCIGDEVNVASRFESLTKEYGLGLLMGEQSARLAGRDEIVEVDRVKVRGKNIATRLFTLAPKGVDSNWLVEHRKFVDALGGDDWQTAEAARLVAAKSAPDTFSVYYEKIALKIEAEKKKKGNISHDVSIEV
jgi:adenylate cyclase